MDSNNFIIEEQIKFLLEEKVSVLFFAVAAFAKTLHKENACVGGLSGLVNYFNYLFHFRYLPCFHNRD